MNIPHVMLADTARELLVKSLDPNVLEIINKSIGNSCIDGKVSVNVKIPRKYYLAVKCILTVNGYECDIISDPDHHEDITISIGWFKPIRNYN